MIQSRREVAQQHPIILHEFSWPTLAHHPYHQEILEAAAMYSTVPHESSEACLAAEDEENADEVSSDEVAIIFGFLSHVDIMRARRVCTTWRDAAKKTIVPSTKFVVGSERSYNAMRVMSTALPNLQQIALYDLSPPNKYSDGEDPDDRRARRAANDTPFDIDIISNFRRLQSLTICDVQSRFGFTRVNTAISYFKRSRIWGIDNSSLNGRYPVFFNFPLLQKLAIYNCGHLKWDLEMLEGLPSLKEIDCCDNPHLTGNVGSLRVLIDTLEKVEFDYCPKIRGDLMDLANFPRLKVLHLGRNKVTGDIRDIRGHDFPVLESLDLPYNVHGGVCHTFQLMSDVPSFMHAIHLLLQRNPKLFKEDLLQRAFCWSLSEDSPDWYDSQVSPFQRVFDMLEVLSGGEIESFESTQPDPPFRLQLIQAGSRRGWSWCTSHGEHSCEINWLDLEPSSESSGHEAYIEELQRIDRRIDFYRGYYDPPTDEEYRRLCAGFSRRT
eukprot:scaffold26504_cov228-Skeletonema_dohrnii-CCMP3373.AAC.11